MMTKSPSKPRALAARKPALRGQQNRAYLDWPKVTIECPEGVEAAILRYWDVILAPQEGVRVHPEDKSKNKKRRAAIKTLLEFFES